MAHTVELLNWKEILLIWVESLWDAGDGWNYGCDGNDPSVNGDKSRRFGNVVVNGIEVGRKVGWILERVS
jgi:hypothetical protein